MSLTSENMGPADIKAVTGNNDGWGNGGGIFYLVILFFFFMFFCNGAWGNGGNGGAVVMPTPYQTSTVTQSDMQRGFDQSAVIGHLDGINSAVSQGFANAEVSRCNQQANILQQMGNNQSALLQQMGNNQSDVMQGFNNIAFAQQGNANATAQGLSDLKYTVAQENCSDRNAMNMGFQQLEASVGSKTQAILDKLCQQEIEQKNDQINQLRQQLYLAQLTASQGQQTANINGNTDNQVQNAINQLKRPTPVPAYTVPNPYGCNCGYAGGCCGVA